MIFDMCVTNVVVVNDKQSTVSGLGSITHFYPPNLNSFITRVNITSESIMDVFYIPINAMENTGDVDRELICITRLKGITDFETVLPSSGQAEGGLGYSFYLQQSFPL